MKEHGIIFSAPMVRAIIEGRKTQTRRMVKAVKLHAEAGIPVWEKAWVDGDAKEPYLHVPFDGCRIKGMATTHRHYCPHPVGTRLWVRETYWKRFGVAADGFVSYVSDEPEKPKNAIRKVPSIHMPRWASRITLEVTGVKVERLQSISDNNAIAEGIERLDDGRWKHYTNPHYAFSPLPTESFRSLWCSIYGEDSWKSNPWVWAYTFKVVEIKK